MFVCCYLAIFFAIWLSHSDALDTRCLSIGEQLPSFTSVAKSSLSNDFPKRCPDCPLGVALNETVLTNGGLYHSGDFSRWHSLMRKLAHQQLHDQTYNLTIGILGGSMTAGNIISKENDESYCSKDNCNQINPSSSILSCQKCSYSQRFFFWLQNAYPKFTIRMINMAIPYTTSQSILNMIGKQLEAESFDLIFVDYGVEDESYEVEEGNSSMKIAAFDNLINFLINLSTEPVIVDIEKFISTNTTLIAASGGIFPSHETILKYYQIPTLTYDLSATSEYLLKSALPSWPYHQMIADYLAYIWKQEAIKSCGYQLKGYMTQYKHVTKQLSTFCIMPLTMIRAKFPTSFKYNESVFYDESQWTFGEDVPGKPGWFIDRKEGGLISFKVTVDSNLFENHAYMIIGVTYLKSYLGMGRVRVYVNEDKSRYVYLDGMNDDPSHHRTSMLYSKRLCVTKEEAAAEKGKQTEHLIPICDEEMDNKVKFASYRGSKEIMLNFELLPSSTGEKNKFKIVDILSC